MKGLCAIMMRRTYGMAVEGGVVRVTPRVRTPRALAAAMIHRWRLGFDVGTDT